MTDQSFFFFFADSFLAQRLFSVGFFSLHYRTSECYCSSGHTECHVILYVLILLSTFVPKFLIE